MPQPSFLDRVQNGLQDFTGPAHLHLISPVILNFCLAMGSTGEPAHVAGLKFPGRTRFAFAGRALFYGPAIFGLGQ